MSWKEKIALWITPVLFFCYFLPQQVYLVNTYDFSVWKGGAMAMFSSPDHPSKRHLFFYVTNPQGITYKAEFNIKNQGYDWVEYKILPKPQILESIINELYERDLYVTSLHKGVITISDEPNVDYGARIQEAVPFDLVDHELIIEFWKMDEVWTEDKDSLNTKTNHYFTVTIPAKVNNYGLLY